MASLRRRVRVGLVPVRRSPTPAIGSCWRSSLRLVRVTHCGGARRVEQAIGGTPYLEDRFPLEGMLDAPDLLRAFIPYAHAQSGIRDELTARTLAMVDALRSSYKRNVLRHAKDWDGLAADQICRRWLR
jgi:hypothetical protein